MYELEDGIDEVSLWEIWEIKNAKGTSGEREDKLNEVKNIHEKHFYSTGNAEAGGLGRPV